MGLVYLKVVYWEKSSLERDYKFCRGYVDLGVFGYLNRD